MKKLFFLISLFVVYHAKAQITGTYQIKGADTVKIWKVGGSINPNATELILMNSSDSIPGFLWNKGNGVTGFKRPLTKINSTTYLVGVDTLYTGAGGGGSPGGANTNIQINYGSSFVGVPSFIYDTTKKILVAGGILNTIGTATNGLIIGQSNISTGQYSSSIGFGNMTGNYGYAFGVGNQVNGYSISVGNANIGTNALSATFGNNLINTYQNSLVIGAFNDTTSWPNAAIASNIANYPAFSIGNGANNSTRSNAFTILHNGGVIFNLFNNSTLDSALQVDINGNLTQYKKTSGGGGGTLDSVGLIMPIGLNVAGSPITGTGGHITVTTPLSGVVHAGAGVFTGSQIVNADVSDVAWSKVTGPPTTVTGYGITNAVRTDLTYSDPSWLTGLAWSKILTPPTTLSGYGITDPVVLTSGSYANPSWITQLVWSKITSPPTTVSGYGITDAVTLTGTQTLTNKTLTSPQLNTPLLNSSSTVGYVWTATNTAGAGSWQVSTGSGSSTFAGLTDVSITSPANNQFPVYNSGTTKWTNISPTTTLIPEGSNLYWTPVRFTTDFKAQTTDTLPEGTSNLYFTNSRARNSISGSPPLVYVSGTGVMSIQQGNTSQNGYISSTDWNNFTAKLSTVQNIASLQNINTIGLSDTSTIYLAGVNTPSDGASGIQIWNPSSTATPVFGMITQPTGITTGRWFRVWDGYHLNALWFGVIGDGTTDNTAAFQAALNFQANTQVYLPSPAVSYIIKNNVYLNTSGVDFIGQDKYGTKIVQPIGNTYLGGGAWRAIFMAGNIHNNGGLTNVHIKHMNLTNNDTVTVSGALTVQPAVILFARDSGFVHLTGMSDSAISFEDLVISNPAGHGAGIVSLGYRNNYGATMKFMNVVNCDFINVAGCASEQLSTNTFGDLHVSDINFSNDLYRNCGTIYPTNGFGISFGGYMTRCFADHITLIKCAGIGVEFGGNSYSTMSNITVDSCDFTIASGHPFVPWVVNNANGNGGGTGQGNSVINCKVQDSTFIAPYYLNQNKLTCIGNVWRSNNSANSGSSIYIIGSVTNSTFSNEHVEVKGAQNASFMAAITNFSSLGISHNNIFTNEYFESDSGCLSMFHFQDSSRYNQFIGCTFNKFTTLINNDGTAEAPLISLGTNYEAQTPFNSGLPTSTNPSSILTQEKDSTRKQILFNGTTTTFLNGAGAFTTPAGGGGGIDSTVIRNDSVYNCKAGVCTFSYFNSPFRIIDIRKYLPPGPILDSITDFASAFQTILSDTSIHGGIILCPLRNMYLSKTVYDTVINPAINRNFTLVGFGGLGSGYNTGVHSALGNGGPTRLFTTSATDTMFVVTGTSTLNTIDVSLQYTGSSTTNTNIGIYYGNASFMYMSRTSVIGFGINVDIKEGFQWQIMNCQFNDAHLFDLRIQDSLFNDAGDSRIDNCSFTQQTARGAGSTLVQYISGGGLHLTNCKFNGGGAGMYPANCIDAPFIGTVDMKFFYNSFENFTKYAFWLHPTTSGTDAVDFSNNQINRYGAGGYSGPIVKIDGTGTTIHTFTIHDNIIVGQGGADTAIYILNVSDGTIANNNISGFTKANTNIVLGAGVDPGVIINVPQSSNSYGAVESGGHLNIDLNYGNLITTTLTFSDTLSCINCTVGQSFTLYVNQNATGGFHLVNSSGSIPGGSSTVLLNPAASAITVLHGFTSSGGHVIVTDISRGFTNGQIITAQSGLFGDPNLTWSSSELYVNGGSTAAGGIIMDGSNRPAIIFKISGTEVGILAVPTSAVYLPDAAANDIVIRDDAGSVLLGSGTGSTKSVLHIGPGPNPLKINGLPPSFGTPNILVRSTAADSGVYQITPANLATLIGAGGAVSSVSNSDGTITISPTTGAVVASVALGHANTWTGVQTQPAPILTGLTSSGANDSTLTVDPSTGQVHRRSGVFNLFFANGLTGAGGDSAYIGGSLNQNTSIANAGNSFMISGTGSIYLNSPVSYLYDVPFDANRTIGSENIVQLKGSITANRTITFPDANLYTGRIIYIDNGTTNSNFNWILAGSGTGSAITDPEGNTISTLKFGTSYTFVAYTQGWRLLSQISNSIEYDHVIFTPTTGSTVNLTNNQYNIINPSGTLLALTVNLPSSPANNDVVYIKFTQAISTVTYANGTVVDGITAPTAGGLIALTYDVGTTSWY